MAVLIANHVYHSHHGPMCQCLFYTVKLERFDRGDSARMTVVGYGHVITKSDSN